MQTRHGGLVRRIAGVIALVLGLGGAAWAQTAPEGNAHPHGHMVSGAAESAPPLGEVTQSTAGAQAKYDFSRAVDLRPLADLAVFHSGRVKVMDTLARESVKRIVGRRRYDDWIVEGGLPAKKVSYDPLFTLLDMAIDPGFYVDRPLVTVGYLPLRKAYLRAAFPNDEASQQRWMKLTRVTPRMINDSSAGIVGGQSSDPQLMNALGELDEVLGLWRRGQDNMLLVPPPNKEQAWVNLSLLPAEHPARRAGLALGAAWRAMDAVKVNDAVRTLAAEMPKINPEVYPSGRRSLEMAYNRANAFEWGAWAYFGSLVSLLLGFGTGRRWLLLLGGGLLTAAVATHGFGFFTRCIIAERFAIQNQFESMTGLSLFAAVVGLSILILKRQWLFGAATAGVGFLVLVAATQAKIPGGSIEREAAILNTSVLLKYHVTTVLCSYGLISLGFIVSLFYLGAHYFGKPAAVRAGVALAGAPGVIGAAIGAGPDAGRERTLKELDTAQMTVLQLAFWTLGVGILLGAWWADHSWGRWWAFDPKETWALITWIAYLIVIHLRFTAKNRGLVTAWMSVAGFFTMLWTYFGVNLILPGLHAYA